jgi:pyruvate dehydrogenase E2 component (dihydrolipoamide acetyltransferase)
VAVLVGYGPRTTEAKRRPRKAAPGREFDEEAHEQVADTFSTGAPVSFRSDVRQPLAPASDEPVGAPLPGPGAPPAEPQPGRTALLAKPPVRKLAKDLGVDLASVPGTGVGGVITRSDVEEAAAARASVPPPAARVNRPAELAESPAPSGESSAPPDLLSAPAPPAAPAPAAGHPAPARQRLPGEDIRVPVKGVRKATAEAMVASAFTAPHVTEWVTCDVTETMELMERLRNRRELAGVRLSPLLLVAKAVCLALGESPDLNAHFDADAQEIVLRGTVNLGIAAATPRGLLVPNIKDAQTLSLLELATAISELVSVAKEGRTQPADTAGGTFTLTNVGVFGVDAGTPILNPGETGILCLGTVARRPWVVGSGAEERIEPRWVTTLALSFDHRAVDGEQGSRFLARVAGILSDPGLALLF